MLPKGPFLWASLISTFLKEVVSYLLKVSHVVLKYGCS